VAIVVRKVVIRNLILVLVVLAAVLGGVDAPAARAQSPGWSPAAAIPDYLPGTLPPYMIADQNKTVHAFASQLLSDQADDPDSEYLGIFYRQWTAKDGWTEPNDIMLSPFKRQARLMGVYLDRTGIFHMIFFGGDDQEASIYYTWAPAVQAGNAQAWAEPIPIGARAITPSAAALVGDDQGRLMAVYAGNLGEGNGWYSVNSNDGGVTWGEPQLVYSTYAINRYIGDYQMVLSESGKVHLVFNVGDTRGQNVGGFYMRLDDLANATWSEPIVIDQNEGLGIATPAITEYNGEVFMMYNNGVVDEGSPRQWFRRSVDGGVTWSEPVRPFPLHLGRNGVIAFAEDGAGKLHVFFGQRIPRADGDATGFDVHGMWHALWLGGNWGPLEPVVSGPRSDSFDPYDARAVISQGNEVLLTWRTDPGREIPNVWFATQKLNAPELPIQPLPEPPQLALLIEPTPTAQPGEEPALPQLDAGAQLQPVNMNFSRAIGAQPTNPGLPLLIGVSTAAILTLLGLVLGAVRAARQR
jgi:hypothetical protein